MKTAEQASAVDELYREYKGLLLSIAYRMLGSMTEAEDAVQDVFVSVSRQDGLELEHPKAYLVKMLTNRALNMMKAAPRRRENYPGQWLPEPIIQLDDAEQPLNRMLRRERLGYALLVLLQNCTPQERAVFVLRESLGYEYADIAAALNKTEAACRKIFSRAAAKLGHRPEPEEGEASLDAKMEAFLQSFAQALGSGRIESFIPLLTDDAVLLGDGGGIVRSALNPILSRKRVFAFLAGIHRKGSLTGELRPAEISGQRGLLLVRDGKPPIAIVLEPDEQFEAVRAVYLITNPEKLTLIT
ncbi:sigma-70 family RNA polymerase sigma factor [Paenibacillus sp. NFR01]|uniref:sigma-70 family RNA polymerase sigma factor n=1 Tax=Paenibacillus sp. NFR01 TaxID=1566279 RepID=UPI0008C0BD5B|nr:sigma-70 family RNA polymerase sigma factor [Paenibacillus sp. NFR01]SEU10809.1 RNA polymerase sigma-70 factor, ECF subfamily [Paenibacillus sp. NFR01]